MALTRRRGELDWPEWFPSRRLFDWPDRWSDLLERSEIRVEEYEEDGKLVVRAEAPGIDPDKDVEVTVDDGGLHIKMERREESRSEDKKGFRSEFRYGSFSRSLPLPAGTNGEGVEATYDNGVLEVRIPLPRDREEARKIPVTRR